MLDEKRKNKTRDGFGIPGLLAEPTGTDGFRVLCRQFAPSSNYPLLRSLRGSVRTENKSQCGDSSYGRLPITQHLFRRSDP